MNPFALMLVAALLCVVAAAAEAAATPGCPWPAVDDLGRALPTSAEVGPPRPGRFVGIFYFLWHDQRGGKSPNWDGPYDVTRILAADPDALKKPASPLWGPIGANHYWGEPLYGYYLGDDAWVLRRHAALLADAGIDTLIFDTTNAVTYPAVYMKLCEVFSEVRREGGRTPAIAFMVNTEAGKTAQRLYDELYSKGLYEELWFKWQGKPLLICDPEAASPEVRAFFTLRRAHWPFEMVNTPYAWHWEATYPQPYGYTDDPAKPEQVNVSVAQNLRRSDGQVTNMSNLDARGRSFHDGHMETGPGAVDRGYNAGEQWKRAFALDPPFVMVTGWNEWIAGRWGQPDGPIVFVDQFTQEFSRDIEPARASHRDNYYYQLVASVRRYKGLDPLPPASGPRTIRLGGGFDQWARVGPAFGDPVGDTLRRDHDGAGGTHYADASGRNDLVLAKVARDDRNVYFYVRARAPLTPRTDPNWMWLLIDSDGDASTGWEGFDYIVNRDVESAGETWLERNAGGWRWERVARVGYRVEGADLHLAVPREALGIAAGGGLRLDFKWADNVQRAGDVMDFYVSGDAAPDGRFRYRYEAE